MKCQKFAYTILVGAFLLGSALLLPATAQQTVLQTDAPGSFLVFPLFDIRSGNATHIRITDTSNGLPSGVTPVRVHLDFICPGTIGTGAGTTYCAENDLDYTLTNHETLDLDIADQFPPCDQGFITAFAVANDGPAIGLPVAYDSLIGSYHIYYGTGGNSTATGAPAGPLSTLAAASESGNALAIQSAKAATFVTPAGSTTPEPATVLGSLSSSGGNYNLTFGTATTADYVALPRVLHGNYRSISSTAPASTAYLILLTLDTTSADFNAVTTVNVGNWAEDETSFSGGSTRFACWQKVALNSIDTHFNQNALGTALGSFKLTSKTTNKSILGAVEEYGTPAVLASLGSATNPGSYPGGATPTTYEAVNIRNLLHCPTYVGGAATIATCATSSTYGADPLP